MRLCVTAIGIFFFKYVLQTAANQDPCRINSTCSYDKRIAGLLYSHLGDEPRLLRRMPRTSRAGMNLPC